MTTTAQADPSNAGGVTGSWDEPSIAVVNPDGVRGKIPISQLQAAGAKGYRVSMWDANGTRGSVPVAQMGAAARAGYTTTPKTQFEQERDPQNQPGFWSSAGTTLENQAKGVASMAAQPWEDAANVYRAARAGGQGVLRSGAEALGTAAISPEIHQVVDVANQPREWNQRKAAGYGLGYRVLAPVAQQVAGVDVPSMERAADVGNARAVAAQAAVPAAEVLAGESQRIPAIRRATSAATEAITRVPRDIATRTPIMNRLVTPEAPRALTQAIQPSVQIPRAGESINIAGPRIQQLRQAGALADREGNPITEIKTPSDLLEATQAAKRHVWDRIEQRLGPVKDLQTDTSPVADAMEKSISGRTRRQFPQIAERIEQRADTYRGNLSLREIESSIQDANDDLKNYYKQAAGARDSPVSADIAATEAEARALRTMLDQKVQQLRGKGVADLKGEYGALRDVERATAKQALVAARQKGAPLYDALANLYAAGDFLSGNPAQMLRGAVKLGMGRRLTQLRDPNYLIDQAFQGKRAFKAAPAIEDAQAPPIRGLLTSGARPQQPITAGAPAGPRALPSERSVPPMSPSRRLPAVGETSPTRTARGVLTTPPLALPPMRGIFAPEGNPMADLGEPVPHYVAPEEPGVLTAPGQMNLRRVVRSAPKAEAAAPTANELKAQIAKLDQQERSLRSATMNARPGTDANMRRYQKMRDIGAKRSDLQAQLERIEPQRPKRSQEELSAAIRSHFPKQPEGQRVGSDTLTHQQARTPAAESKTPTYDKLDPRMRQAIDDEMRMMKEWPDVLREDREKEVRAGNPLKYVPLKENMARWYLKNYPNGMPEEQ
jgi:hypothetical protein